MEKMMDSFDQQLLGVTPEEDKYSNKLVEAALGDDVFKRDGGQPVSENAPQDLGAAAAKPEKLVYKDFKDLGKIKDLFPKAEKREEPKMEQAPQNLGAAAAESNKKRIPYPIHSELGRMKEGLRDSKERLERMEKEHGPKLGIEHYKKQINFYEEEIKKAEEAKTRYLNSIQKSVSKKSGVEKNQFVEAKTQDEITQKNPNEQPIKQEIGERLNLIDSNEKPIREVDNTPKFDAFNKPTLKDLAGIEESMKSAKNVAEKIDFGRHETKEAPGTPVKSISEGWYGKAEELEMHKFNQAISRFEDTTEKKIEAKGNWVMERARSTGEWYKKQPFKRKILLSGALIATASASALIGGPVAGTIATAAFTGTLMQRALGGLATFVATEAWLKRSAEKGGMERTKAEATRQTIEAAALGMLVGSGYAAEGIKTISDATGLTTLITDAYNYWLPPEDMAKITNAIKTPFIETSTTPPTVPSIDANIPTTPDIAPEINANADAVSLDSNLANVAEGVTKEVAERGLTSDFSIELGKNGVPGSLERVFHMMAANHMDLKGTVIFGEAEGAKSLNIAANLVKLAEGNNLADVDNVAGISASEFNNAAVWDKTKNFLTIKDHNAFNKIVENLESRSNALWDQGVLKTGAVAYLNDIKPETWVETLHADSLDKIGDIETGITGHDDIIPSQITDFDNSEMVKAADEAQRKIAERLDTLRNELLNPEPLKGETYTITGADKNTPSGAWESAKNAPITANGESVLENVAPAKVPAKEALENLANYNVNKIMNDDINKLFGSKGFLGFGAKNGLESAEWLKAKDLPATKAGGVLKKYLENLQGHTGSALQSNETTESYIKRAIAHFMKDDELVKTPISKPILTEIIPKPTPEIFTPTEVPHTQAIEPNIQETSRPTVFGYPKAPLPPKDEGFIWVGGDNNK
ncbi:MAG: hypothetical protein NUV64_02125 [Parcubacteria group bacterium]|nr:hypothetical protein [Parcubacteria group bacterium]MCR4342810.1 hypothetical protein [Patescibacteria group bacterium]